MIMEMATYYGAVINAMLGLAMILGVVISVIQKLQRKKLKPAHGFYIVVRAFGYSIVVTKDRSPDTTP